MKTISHVLLLWLISIQVQAQGSARKAERFVTLLSQATYDSAAAMVDPSVAAQITPTLLGQLWSSLNQRMGTFTQIGTTRTVAENKAYDVVCQFANGELDIRCSFNPAGNLIGLFLPSQPRMKATTYADAPYVRPDALKETELTVRTGEFSLPAVFTYPGSGQEFPVVVFVHGSGPNDKDESVGPNKIFRDLAKGLASQGIASLRYDKRTYVAGNKLNPATITYQEEVTQDVKSAIELARSQPGADKKKVFVLGHSLGAMLAPTIAAENPGLAGIILMAGNARPLEDLIVEQYTYLANSDGQVSDEEKRAIEQAKRQASQVKHSSLSASTPADSLPLRLSGTYWLALKKYSPTQTAQSLKCPILILQGENDRQVTLTDYNQWQQALKGKKNVQFRSFKGLNHIFLPGSTPADYQTQNYLPIEVVDSIAAWVKK